MTDQATGTTATFSFNLDYYVLELRERLEGHLATLRNTLRALDDGSYVERAGKTASNALIRLELSTTRAPSDVAEEEIRNTFHEMMRSFGDFVDTLTAMKRIRASGTTLTRAINGFDELEEYIDQEIKAETDKVAHDKSLSTTKKVDALATLDTLSRDALDSYVAVRNAIEHHKSIAGKDIEFWAHEMFPIVEDEPVTAFPVIVEKGQWVGMRQQTRSRTFAQGQPIILSERDLEDVYRTIMSFIVADLVKGLIGQPT